MCFYNRNTFLYRNDLTRKCTMKGKRVVLFAVPGAFTPTCSDFHVPGYEKHYEAIRAEGIDEIYCLAVNDAFTMRQARNSEGLMN